VVVVVGDDAVAATGEHVVLLVRCGNSMLVQVTVVVVVDVGVEVTVVVAKVAVAVHKTRRRRGWRDGPGTL